MLSQIKHVMQDSNKPSAIIVGAGPGGLASAMLLAYSGVDVTVILGKDINSLPHISEYISQSK